MAANSLNCKRKSLEFLVQGFLHLLGMIGFVYHRPESLQKAFGFSSFAVNRMTTSLPQVFPVADHVLVIIFSAVFIEVVFRLYCDDDANIRQVYLISKFIFIYFKLFLDCINFETGICFKLVE